MLPTEPALPDAKGIVVFAKCYQCGVRIRRDVDINALLSVPPEYRWLVVVCEDCHHPKPLAEPPLT